MKTCAQCGLENPSSALHCMGCGALLVEKEKLTEEQKLQKQIQELERENEILKTALESKSKEDRISSEDVMETTETNNFHEDGSGESIADSSQFVDSFEELNDTQPSDATESTHSTSEVNIQNNDEDKKTNKSLLVLAICLVLLVGIVGGGIYWNEVYLPAKKDADAPRYYVYASSLKIRNSSIFEDDANIIGSVPYGSELIVYDSVPGEYFYCKYSPHDATGKVIKDQVIEGYVHYNYVLPKNDFVLLNSIFGNDDAKVMLPETRFKRALLEVYKRNHYIGNLTEDQLTRYNVPADILWNSNGRYQVFCRDIKAKSNNVYRSRKYRKNSKYTDAAIILDNLDDPTSRLFLYFIFDDDETPSLLVSCHIQNKGYMKDGTLKLYENDGEYWASVQFEK